MTGKPVFAASAREKVLFPDPAMPVTRTRRPIPKAASLIDVSVPQFVGLLARLRQLRLYKRGYRASGGSARGLFRAQITPR